MKRITAIRLFSIVTAISAPLLFTSCGDKKDGGGDDSAQTEKKDTPDSLTDELIVQMNALADAMVSAKDKASAEEAAKKVEGIGDAVESIATRLDKLETPSEEDKKKLDEKMDKAQEAMGEKMGAVMGAMMSNEEIGEVLGPAMQKFGERMKKHDPIFERFGKKK
ncbi:MAG: hypothetical protein AB8F34_14095 [Akkermansiaceae bacterium]